jgi:acyl-CoA thioester hydrolase
MSEFDFSRTTFWFHHPFRVRYAEADRAGNLFNAFYLTYFSSALAGYFRALPFDIRGEEHANHVAIHVVRAAIDIATPPRFDDEVDFAMRIARLSRSSATFAFAVFLHGRADLLASGEETWVFTDRKTQKSTPWPAALRDIVRRREGPALIEV